MKAKKFDKAFDDGEDISALLDLGKVKRVKQQIRRVNVDFPEWMIESLDREAARTGVSRQSVIKVWLAERLKQQKAGFCRFPDCCGELFLFSLECLGRGERPRFSKGHFYLFVPNPYCCDGPDESGSKSSS
jgi:hypothetical protein